MSAGEDFLLEESLEQKPMSFTLLQRIFALTRRYRWLIAANVAGTLLAVTSQLLGPYLIRTGINRYLTHVVSPEDSTRGVMMISGLYFANLLLGWALTVAQVRTSVTIGWRIMNDLRLEVFEHIQALSLAYFDKTHQGRIINRADADVDAMEQVLSWGANQLLASLMTLIGVFVIMLSYSWRLCLVVSIVLPPLAVGTFVFQRMIMEAHRQMKRQSSRLTATLAENISAVRVVQAMGREEQNLGKFQELHGVLVERAYDVARIFHTYMPSLGLVSGIGVALVLGYGGMLALKLPPEQLALGDLTAFILYVNMFFGPVQTMGDLYNNVLSAGASAERIFQLLDTKPQVVNRANAAALPTIHGGVRFERVSFRYETTPEERWVLDDVDFAAEAGQTVALVGHTGSGKTSIISLLARFYEPQRGRILVDGHDIAQATVESLHRQLGIVTQENFLFTGTILENLRFGRPEATEEEIHAAARAVGTDELIRQMKDGYATRVAERGGNFSAGTRQLICITRALVAQPRILILDEATSAVDSKSEALIQSALDILLEGRTTFVIAHRLSTVRKASLILVLQHGKIVERGTHETLTAAGGVYAGLHAEFARQV